MSVEHRAVNTLSDAEVTRVAANARARWQRLIDLDDRSVVEHVVTSMSTKSSHQVLQDVREAYQIAHDSGAVPTYLVGMAQAATIVAKGLGEPIPQWLRGNR